MNKLAIILITLFGSLAWTVTAQDTNLLKTQIGVFENRTGSVIIKAFGPVGSVMAGPQEITVRVKETSDISVGQKIYGLSIDIEGGTYLRDRIYVDEDEIDALLSAINYLLKIKYDVTALPSFEAGFTTKAGLRIIAHSIRREGSIQHSVQYCDGPRILLNSMQMSQLYTLIAQARKNVDALKAGQ
jgi:hypothetical protein